MTSEIDIVKLLPEEWREYRKIRLEALQESPQAFGSNYHDQREKPESNWRRRLEEAQAGEKTWLLFARAGNRLVGMIGAYCEEVEEAQQKDQATIIAVYVSPRWRGKGISKRLMQAILDELAAKGFRKAILGVNGAQKAAVGLYQRFGFVITSYEAHPMGDGLVHEEMMMEKLLA